MRRINPTCLKVNISQAGLPEQGLMQISVGIPIDKYKYLSGDNLIDCIVPQSVPDIPSKLSYLLEEIDSTQLGLLAGLISTGTAIDQSSNQYSILRAIEYLGYLDNALSGTIAINPGDKVINHIL
jgi:hypothetical protein